MKVESPPERITKIQAAERQLVAAIELFFRNADSIVVYSVACAAREIIHSLCEKRKIKSFFDEILEDHPHLSRRDLRRLADQHRNFFKHADSDPDAVLEQFSDDSNDAVLFVATHDFGRLTGGMPIEMQVFETWFLSCDPTKLVPGHEEAIASLFPGISTMNRFEKKHRGLVALKWARSQPGLRMVYATE
jgi:hypothetical protein